MITENARRPEPWNKAETLERLGGDEALLQELVQIFLDESPRLLQKLREAIPISDAEALMRGAHSLKGELICLGGDVAANVANELETMGRTKELSGAAQAFIRMESELRALEVILRDTVAMHP